MNQHSKESSQKSDGKTKEEAIEEYNSKFRELVEEAWGMEGMEIGQLCKLAKEAARKKHFQQDKREGKETRL